MNIHNPGNLALLDRVSLQAEPVSWRIFKSVAKIIWTAVSLINDEAFISAHCMRLSEAEGLTCMPA